MKWAVILLLAVGGYFAWKHFSEKQASEPAPAPAAAGTPAPNQHGENRATAFSGAAPE